jgi:sugar lactone lactonase YvrE
VVRQGGPAAAVTAFDRTRAEVGHNAGFFLSDARRFVLHARAVDPAKSATFLGSIDATGRTPLGLDSPTKPAYGNGYFVYVQGGTLMAQPFNNANGSSTGKAVPVVENVDYNPRNGRAGFSISSNGVLAYRSGMTMTSGTLDWFDMTGQRVASLPFQGGFAGLSRPQISPDGHRLAVARSDGTRYDVWIVDLERGIPSRLNSSDRLANNYPVWSPDGAFVVFRSTETPFGPGSGVGGNLYRHSAFGAGTDDLLHKSPEDTRPFAISPDGKTLLFGRSAVGNESDIWALPMSGDRTPYPVVATRYADGQASFSPDGRWFAYCSDDVAPDQVYVEPFPPDGSTRIRLSTTSGSSPVWSRDGKRVFYSTADKHIMAVDVSVEPNTLRAGVPRDLFVARSEMFTHNGFAVDATGTRFLLPVSKAADNAITVVLNWTQGLTRR